jgi:hypothetical protein
MQTLFWDDASAVVTIEKKEASLDFKVYDVIGHSQDAKGDFTTRLYERKGATRSGDDTENLDEAQTMLHGTIKWDACSHLYFGDEGGYLHVCGGNSWRQLQTVISRLFEYAEKELKQPHSADMWEK